MRRWMRHIALAEEDAQFADTDASGGSEQRWVSISQTIELKQFSTTLPVFSWVSVLASQ
jgi:hypothetical protein